jgi:hypothetical protein
VKDRTSAGAATAADLPEAWRARAADLRAFGSDERAALLWERAADELEAAAVRTDDFLTLRQAHAACGYSADHLGRLVRQGKLRNYGRLNAPRLRRSELPTKAGVGGSLPRTGIVGEISRVELARAVIKRHVGGE